MADEIKKEKHTAMKFFIAIAFVAIGYLLICNYNLKQKLELCSAQLEFYSDQMSEFHKNLYAQVEGSYRDGAHKLSISDVYYRKYYKSLVDEKKN